MKNFILNDPLEVLNYNEKCELQGQKCHEIIFYDIGNRNKFILKV